MRAAEVDRAAGAERDARTKIFPAGTEAVTRQSEQRIGGPSSITIDTGLQGQAPTEWLSAAAPEVTEQPPVVEEHAPD